MREFRKLLKENQEKINACFALWMTENRKAVRRAVACSIPVLLLLVSVVWIWGFAHTLTSNSIDPILGLDESSGIKLHWILSNLIIPPIFGFIIIVLLVVAGHFLGTRIGRMFRRLLDTLEGIPILGALYRAGKQLGQTLDSEQGTFSGKPVWTLFADCFVLALMTKEVDGVATILILTSPSPVNGYAVVRPRDEVELAHVSDGGIQRAVTIDELLQYVLSGGVAQPSGLIPPTKMNATAA